jgi:hypothetical protein
MYHTRYLSGHPSSKAFKEVKAMAGLERKDPKGFAQLYHKITWHYDKDHYQVDVRKYLSLNPHVCDPNRIGGAKTARSWLISDLKEQAEEQGKRYLIKEPARFINLGAIENSFAGSATPDELEQTLWLATHLGYIVRNYTHEEKTCTADKFADWYLGMDCTGFARAFLGLDFARSIKSYDTKPMLRRQAIKDIQSRDVMLIKGDDGEYEHIAIVVNKVLQPPDVMALHTAEASGQHMEGGWMQGVTGDVKRLLKSKSPGVFVSATKPGAEYYFYPMP